jgi:hypothetical protein
MSPLAERSCGSSSKQERQDLPAKALLRDSSVVEAPPSHRRGRRLIDISDCSFGRQYANHLSQVQRPSGADNSDLESSLLLEIKSKADSNCATKSPAYPGKSDDPLREKGDERRRARRFCRRTKSNFNGMTTPCQRKLRSSLIMSPKCQETQGYSARQQLL